MYCFRACKPYIQFLFRIIIEQKPSYYLKDNIIYLKNVYNTLKKNKKKIIIEFDDGSD